MERKETREEGEEVQNKRVKRPRYMERKFGGNYNYVKFFNAQLRDVPLQKVDRSKVKNVDDERTIGTEWSSYDKELFFVLLGRHSIHNIDIVAKQLGRNEIDVLNYYSVLKRELLRRRRSKRYRKSLVRMDEMPIAYEMSETFIEMENHQLDCMIQLETSRLLDFRNRPNQRIIDNEDTLIDSLRLTSLHDLFIDPLWELHISSHGRVTKEFHEFLSDLVKITTKSIIAELIREKYSSMIRKLADKRDFDANEPMFSVTLKKTDIRQAFKKLYPTTPSKLLNFWRQYPERNNYLIEDEKERIFKSESYRLGEILQVIKRRLVSTDVSNENQTLENEYQDHAQNFSQDQSQTQLQVPDSQDQSQDQTEEQSQISETQDQEPESEELNHRAKKRFKRETKYLELKDIKESRLHEHLILCYLASDSTVQEITSETPEPHNIEQDVNDTPNLHDDRETTEEGHDKREKSKFSDKDTGFLLDADIPSSSVEKELYKFASYEETQTI